MNVSIKINIFLTFFFCLTQLMVFTFRPSADHNKINVASCCRKSRYDRGTATLHTTASFLFFRVNIKFTLGH